jgi:hypothetical protein
MNKVRFDKAKTVKVILVLLEVAAAARAGIATWNVTMHTSGGDMVFSLFTVIVVEGVFMASLFMMTSDAIAPIVAFFALLFSGAMQYLELAIMQGELTPQDNAVVRGVVAFAPIVILFFAFLRRLVSEEQIEQAIDAAKETLAGLGTKEQKPQIEITPEMAAQLQAMMKQNEAHTNGRAKDF